MTTTEVQAPQRRVQAIEAVSARARRYSGVVLGTVSILMFFVGWELLAAAEVINPLFTSRPSAIAGSFVDMYITTGDIWTHLRLSLYEAGVGFALGAAVGIPMGVLIGSSRLLRQMSEPFLMGLYSTPTVAFFPLLIMWFGIGSPPKITLIFLGGVFPFLINTQMGVQNVDHELVEAARSFRANPWQLFTKVKLPAALPYILAGTRLAIGRVLVMMFVAQLVLANRGLGYVVSNAGVTFRTDRLFVGVLTLTALGMALTQLVRMIEERKFGYVRQD